MDEQIWLERARTLSKTHASTAEPDLRLQMIQLFRLALEMPDTAQGHFQTILERDLEHRSRGRRDKLVDGDLNWGPAPEADLFDWCLAATAQLRACDDACLKFAPEHHGPGQASDWLCEAGGAYVVPRRRPLRPSAGPGRNGSVLRRGLLHHRILPTSIGGRQLRLIRMSSMSGNGEAPQSVSLGGALFDGAVVTVSVRDGPTGKRFKAVGFGADDAEGAIARQVGAAIQDRCRAVVWPELSMPPRLADAVVRSLKAQMFLANAASRPELIVAGSWHLPISGGMVNRAPVLDGFGDELHSYDKAVLYGDADLGTEDVEPANDLLVVATDDALYGIAICKDFCTRAPPSRLRELPLDIVLVASFGGENTLSEHSDAARDHRVILGSQTFVAQQMLDSISTSDGVGATHRISARRGAVLSSSGTRVDRFNAENGWIVGEIHLA